MDHISGEIYDSGEQMKNFLREDAFFGPLLTSE
jgi:hypothetical protein